MLSIIVLFFYLQAILCAVDRFALIKTAEPGIACIGSFLDEDYLVTTANCAQKDPQKVS